MNYLKPIVYAGLVLAASGCATIKKSKQTPTATKSTLPPAGTPTAGATGSSATPARPSSGPKSFRSFFDAAKLRTQKGLITTHWQDDKYYFEIPDSLLGRDLLTVTRFVRMTAGATVYGGEMTNNNVLRFERGPENKVFIRSVLNVVSSPDSTKPIYQAVRNSNLDPIAAAFDIKAFNGDTTGVVIDVTDFFKGDNQIVSLNPRSKRQLGLSSIAMDRSYVETIRSFPNNTEVRTVKTFNATPASPMVTPGPTPNTTLPAANAAGVVTIETNTSFIRLPEQPFKRRFFDPRVG